MIVVDLRHLDGLVVIPLQIKVVQNLHHQKNQLLVPVHLRLPVQNHLWKSMVMGKPELQKTTKLLIVMYLPKGTYRNPLTVLDHQPAVVHLQVIDPVQNLIQEAVAALHHHVQNLAQEAQVHILDLIVIK